MNGRAQAQMLSQVACERVSGSSQPAQAAKKRKDDQTVKKIMPTDSVTVSK